MEQLNNRTPFAAELFAFPDPHGQEIVLTVVSATFEAEPSGKLRLAEQQVTVRTADEYHGKPGRSSIRYEADVALQKPLVDLLVNAQAYAPGGRPVQTVLVGINVGDIRKVLVVHGDRYWATGLTGASPSAPHPFVSMPIVYERAYGGTDTRPPDPTKHAAEMRNPVGVGFHGVASQDPRVMTEVPNIEYPNVPIRSRSDAPAPAGFGVLGRGWLPRSRYAGTYDEAWLRDQWPLLPRDFDPCHYQAAPQDQQSRMLQGGAEVRLVNLTPDGEWRFRLPMLDVPVSLYYDNRHAEVALVLDTVLIEPDLRRVMLTARVGIPTVRSRGMLREIVLGHMSRGWLRARAARKRYIDHKGLGGALSSEMNYRF